MKSQRTQLLNGFLNNIVWTKWPILLWLAIGCALNVEIIASHSWGKTDAPITMNAEDAISVIPTLANGDLYALCVGISKYQNSTIPALNASAKDARDFASFLQRQRELFCKTRITLLTDAEATKQALDKFLFYELRKAGKQDTIFIFLSGHGAVDPKLPGQFFFLTHDTDPQFLGVSALNMTGLKFLQKLDCPRMVLVADACHAGGFSKWGTKAVMPMKQFIHDISSSTGRVVITSSRPEEYSLEDPRIGNSLFTRYFLEGLKGAADGDKNGAVTIHEAYKYVYNMTKNESEGAQHPQFEGKIEGEFPLAVSMRLRSLPATKLQLLIDPPGADVFVAGRLVGRTNPDGSMFLKYLPLGQPISVKIRKEGWLAKDLGPFVFSEKKLEHRSRLTLKPAVSTLEIVTSPGRVQVKIDDRDVGKTNQKGRLNVYGVQVAIPHTIELVKKDYEDYSTSITIPTNLVEKSYIIEAIKLERIVKDTPRSDYQGLTRIGRSGDFESSSEAMSFSPLKPSRSPAPAEDNWGDSETGL